MRLTIASRLPFIIKTPQSGIETVLHPQQVLQAQFSIQKTPFKCPNNGIKTQAFILFKIQLESRMTSTEMGKKSGGLQAVYRRSTERLTFAENSKKHPIITKAVYRASTDGLQSVWLFFRKSGRNGKEKDCSSHRFRLRIYKAC